MLKIIIGMDANHFILPENLVDGEGNQIFFLAPSKT